MGPNLSKLYKFTFLLPFVLLLNSCANQYDAFNQSAKWSDVKVRASNVELVRNLKLLNQPDATPKAAIYKLESSDYIVLERYHDISYVKLHGVRFDKHSPILGSKLEAIEIYAQDSKVNDQVKRTIVCKNAIKKRDCIDITLSLIAFKSPNYNKSGVEEIFGFPVYEYAKYTDIGINDKGLWSRLAWLQELPITRVYHSADEVKTYQSSDHLLVLGSKTINNREADCVGWLNFPEELNTLNSLYGNCTLDGFWVSGTGSKIKFLKFSKSTSKFKVGQKVTLQPYVNYLDKADFITYEEPGYITQNFLDQLSKQPTFI